MTSSPSSSQALQLSASGTAGGLRLLRRRRLDCAARACRTRPVHVIAHHVDHQLRAESSDEAAEPQEIACRARGAFLLHNVHVDDGPNLEARARQARRVALPAVRATVTRWTIRPRRC